MIHLPFSVFSIQRLLSISLGSLLFHLNERCFYICGGIDEDKLIVRLEGDEYFNGYDVKLLRNSQVLTIKDIEIELDLKSSHLIQGVTPKPGTIVRQDDELVLYFQHKYNGKEEISWVQLKSGLESSDIQIAFPNWSISTIKHNKRITILNVESEKSSDI